MASSAVGANAFLKVNPSDLNTKAGEIQTQISKMEDLMNQMRSVFGMVSENWQSTSGAAYEDKANVLIKEITESLTYLNDYVVDLNTAGSKYEELESELSSRVNNLDDPSSVFNV